MVDLIELSELWDNLNTESDITFEIFCKVINDFADTRTKPKKAATVCINCGQPHFKQEA